MASASSITLSGGKSHGTNNEMELLAVDQALKALKGDGHKVTMYTDSQSVIGWMTPKGQPGHYETKKPDIRKLVGQVCAARDLKGHTLHFVKVAGHSGDEMNEAVDQLAKEAVPRMASLPI